MRLLIFIAAVFMLASCNTWEGIKKDSKDVGEAIGEAAETVGKAIKEATE